MKNMKQNESEEIIWGKWECPVCGDINEDPNTIYETTCSNGHTVRLSNVDGNGLRDTYTTEPPQPTHNK